MDREVQPIPKARRCRSLLKMKNRELLFEEVAQTIDFWVRLGTESLSDQNTDLAWTENPDVFSNLRIKCKEADIQPSELSIVFSEILRGSMVSFLTTIDGGTKLSEKMQIHLVDDTGDTVDELHQEFVNYLVKTDRL